jgi:large subunit ribosomal protein L4e
MRGVKMAEKVKKTEKTKNTQTKAKPQKKQEGRPKRDHKVNLYSIEGKSKKKIDLPPVFKEDIRRDLIKRAHKASRANRRQPYGPNPNSGMRHAVSTWGKGRGVARVQRLTQGRNAAESPGNVGGRRAHPPRPEKDWSQKINRKESKKARNSALSATGKAELVSQRGHKFDGSLTMPLVVEDAIEEIATTRDAVEALQKLGLEEDIIRAKSGIHIRAGRGKMRGRKYRKPKSLLVIVRNKQYAQLGFGNLTGVDVATPFQLSIELLAPGGTPGRLTMITEGALKQMEGW